MWFGLIRLAQIAILKWFHVNEIVNFVESVDEFRESAFFGAKERRICCVPWSPRDREEAQ